MIDRLVAHDRIPPQALEFEQAVLGACLLSREAVEVAAEILRPSDFYRSAHASIFAIMLDLADKDDPIETLTVQERLRDREELEEVGGAPYLIQLLDACPTPSSVSAYAAIVKEKATLRGLIDAAHKITALAHSEFEDIEEVAQAAEATVYAVTEGRGKNSGSTMRQVVARVFEEAEEAAEHPGRISGLATGLSDLDDYTGGLHPSELVIIAGRTSTGKSSLAATIAQNVAAKHPVLYVTLEMSEDETVRRMTCSLARVSLHRFRNGDLTPEDWHRVGEACSSLAALPIRMLAPSGFTPQDLRSQVRRMKPAPALAVVDYVQLMDGGKKAANESERLTQITRGLKAVAREFKIPVIGLAQVNREAEKRKGKRPELSDLKGSGSIEEDADLVLMIYRPELYKAQASGQRPPEHEAAEIIVAKQRNGPVGSVPVSFHGAYTRFDNLAKEQGNGWTPYAEQA